MKRIKITHIEIQADCTHRMGDLPFWHDEGKQYLSNVILSALNQKEALLQEFKGIVKSENVTAFDSALVRKMFNKRLNPRIKPEELDEDPVEIFCFIDPTGGSDSTSEFALISAFPHRGQYVRCGLELITATKTRQYLPYLIAHLQALRTLPRLANTKILIATENNAPLQAADICEEIQRQVGNVIFLNNDSYQITNVKLHKGSRKKQGGYGTHTSGLVLENAWALARNALQNQTMRFYENMIVLYGKDKNKTPEEEALSKLERQYLDYAQVYKKPSKDIMPGFEEEEYTFSGKHKGPDDGTKADQLNNFWMWQYINNPAYRTGGNANLV